MNNTNSRTDHFFIYPEDKNGKYTGHVICVLLRENEMYEGVALCSPKDNFCKKTGRELSLKRALEAYVNRMSKKAESQKQNPKTQKIKVSHYESQCIGFKSEKSIYKVKRKDNPTSSGLSKTQYIELWASDMDKNWTEKALKNQFAQLEESGDGISINFRDKSTIKLDYSEAHDLCLLLDLFYKRKPYKGYNFRRVK